MSTPLTAARWLTASLLGLATLATLPVTAMAADAWPTRPIRVIIPFPPGGPTDTLVRTVAGPLGEKLGQTVVVQNRAGAGGAIGVDAVAKAAPDGYTFGLGSGGALVALPHLTQVPYSVTDGLAYVSGLARVPAVIAVNADAGIDKLDQLLDRARKTPGKLNYASPGSGTLAHLVGERFIQETKVDIAHIPYKGAAPAITDLLGNQVDVTVLDLTPILPHVQAGKVRALAVTTAERTPLLPDVPTMTELGYPNVLHTTEYGIIAPPGIPDDILGKVQSALADVLASQSVRDAYARMGTEPAASTSAAYRATVLDTYKTWGDFIKERGITLN